MRLNEIRVSGFGGQGVILAAKIIGMAASLHEKGYATMTQNFGPEARGGASSAQLVISDEPVLYPYITRPEILIAMSQEAFDKFCCETREGGIVLIESDLVHITNVTCGVRIYAIPATRLAENLGRKVVQNVVMLGFFCALTKMVGRDAMLAAVANSVPSSAVDLNTRAFETGYEYGLKKLGEGPREKYTVMAPREYGE